MPFRPVKILSFDYDLPQPYSAAHSCSPAEAEALNQLLAKGMAKGLYKVLAAGIARTGVSDSKFLTDDQRSDIEDQGLEYINDFSLGFAQGHDFQRSLRVEAERIARGILESQLYKQGKSIKDLGDGEKTERISLLAGSESVRDEALRRVKVTQEIASRAHIELLGEESAE
jgi:hypothetical protein